MTRTYQAPEWKTVEISAISSEDIIKISLLQTSMNCQLFYLLQDTVNSAKVNQKNRLKPFELIQYFCLCQRVSLQSVTKYNFTQYMSISELWHVWLSTLKQTVLTLPSQILIKITSPLGSCHNKQIILSMLLQSAVGKTHVLRSSL